MLTSARIPCAVIFPAASVTFAPSRPQMTTSPPFSFSCRAISNPIRELPPVTSARTSESFMRGFYVSGCFTGPHRIIPQGAHMSRRLAAVVLGAMLSVAGTATGATWTRGDLPFERVYDLAAHPTLPGIAFAATSSGPYRTTAAGPHWDHLS